MSKEKCNGVLKKRANCYFSCLNDSKYCKSHQYFNDLSDEIIESIRNNTNDDYKSCTRCDKWHNGLKMSCDTCVQYILNNRKQRNNNKIRCDGINNSGNKCTKSPINGTKFCKTHDYMINYTPEQMNNLKFCSGCKKPYSLPNNQKICYNCSTRCSKIREDKSVKQKELPRCKECSNEALNEFNNEYCKKHKKYYYRDIAIKNGNKTCGNFHRGCYEELPANYKKATCGNCLNTANIQDKKYYDERSKLQEQYIDNLENDKIAEDDAERPKKKKKIKIIKNNDEKS